MRHRTHVPDKARNQKPGQVPEKNSSHSEPFLGYSIRIPASFTTFAFAADSLLIVAEN